jgi:hypothetical protein
MSFKGTVAVLQRGSAVLASGGADDSGGATVHAPTVGTIFFF